MLRWIKEQVVAVAIAASEHAIEILDARSSPPSTPPDIDPEEASPAPGFSVHTEGDGRWYVVDPTSQRRGHALATKADAHRASYFWADVLDVEAELAAEE